MINHPHLMKAGDFVADRSDLISAAQGEPMSKEQIKAARDSTAMVAYGDPSTGTQVAAPFAESNRYWRGRRLKSGSAIALQAEIDRILRGENCLLASAPSDAKVGSTLRIRLPNDYNTVDEW